MFFIALQIFWECFELLSISLYNNIMNKHILNKCLKSVIDRVTTDYLPRKSFGLDFAEIKKHLFAAKYAEADCSLQSLIEKYKNEPNTKTFLCNYRAINNYYLGQSKEKLDMPGRIEKLNRYKFAYAQLHLYFSTGENKEFSEQENVVFYLYYRLLSNMLSDHKKTFLPDTYKLFSLHRSSLLEESVLEDALAKYQEPAILIKEYLKCAVTDDYFLLWENLLPKGKVNYQLFKIDTPLKNNYTFSNPESGTQHLESLYCLGDIYLKQNLMYLFNYVTEMINKQINPQ